MTRRRPLLTLGIEEEYLLVELESGALVAARDPAFFKAVGRALGERVSAELFQAQLEVATGICPTVRAARAELAACRATIATIGARHGIGLLAASTHPFSAWSAQNHSGSSRYRAIAADYQLVARRALVCGMHVHAGIADPDQRIRLMNAVTPYLPLFLALSASSPFWQGRATGLKAFRPSVFGEFPRTGIPERFRDIADWQAFTDLLAETGVCPDPSKIWWDLRPSARQPTLELRITEVCTELDDAMALAALYQCLLHRLARRPALPDPVGRRFARLLTEENKWQAQRHGLAARFAAGRDATPLPLQDWLDRLLPELAPAAAALDCVAELEDVRRIAARGTSADRQRESFERARGQGLGDAAALAQVVQELLARGVPDLGNTAIAKPGAPMSSPPVLQEERL